METNGIAFVIFGVTGDLTRRKLLPALYELSVSNRLPEKLFIFGFARRDWSDELMRSTLNEAIHEFSRVKPVNEEHVKTLLENAYYIQSSFEDINGYHSLCEKIKSTGISKVLLYLATPPDEYVNVIQHLEECGLNHEMGEWSRIVVEKPYGRDEVSAQELEREIHKVFKESQIYRIDHYLGKETVQNILVFRFANGIFEPLWNRNFIDHIQITVAETVGVGSRAGYYEEAGVIRDMFQNHLLQLLTLTAMEAPVGFSADAVRDEKVKVLKALRPFSPIEITSNTFRAQYVAGKIDAEKVIGYKDEKGVSGSTVTETYLAAKLLIDNWRWSGVPFYLRSGKRLPRRVTEIAIHFRQVPLSLFSWRNLAGNAPNVLALNIQPNEGITLSFGAKAPGPVNQITPVKMEFNYEETFGGEPPEAYERLLLDCLLGDATLFTRSDEVKAQWGFTTQILNAWNQSAEKNLPVYEAGTWGPPGADEFIQKDGRVWRNC